MAEINLTINGRAYGVSCDEGQEKRVIELAAFVDERVKSLSRASTASNDTHLLVLASLMLADELQETKNMQANHAAAVQQSRKPPVAGLGKDEELTLAKVLDHLTSRIETLASQLEAA